MRYVPGFSPCRTVGRRVQGPPIDRALGDMIPRGEKGEVIGLDVDLGRDFLYARYNPELTREGLTRLGLGSIAPKSVATLDAVGCIEALRQIGRKAAESVTIEPFTPFLAG
jgi:hypothetical protein